MKKTQLFLTVFWISLLGFLVVGCKPEAARPSVGPSHHASWPEALEYLSSDLVVQLASSNVDVPRRVPVDLFFDEKSAEEVVSSKALQQEVISALTRKVKSVSFDPLSTRSLQNASWVLLSSFSYVKQEEAGKPGAWVRLRMAMADINSGTVMATATTFLDSRQFQGGPSRFYKEAPMYLADAGHQDRAAVVLGKKRSLIATLPVRAKMNEAIELYENGKHVEAEQAFRAILGDFPKHTAALSGLYQSLWLQKKSIEAEQVFERLVSAGLEEGKLTVKLLFRVGSTEFVTDGDLAAQFSMWIRAISRQVVEKKLCLDVIGHASASGSSDYNDRLSLSRAAAIVSRMQQASRTTTGRLTAIGRGVSETIVGTGSNDSSDAIDRRVEFSVRSCP